MSDTVTPTAGFLISSPVGSEPLLISKSERAAAALEARTKSRSDDRGFALNHGIFRGLASFPVGDAAAVRVTCFSASFRGYFESPILSEALFCGAYRDHPALSSIFGGGIRFFCSSWK